MVLQRDYYGGDGGNGAGNELPTSLWSCILPFLALSLFSFSFFFYGL